METVVNEHVEINIYHRAKSGNRESGDTYFVHSTEDYFICAIADGLGSGPIARQSAEIIPNVIKKHHDESLDELLSRCNEYMIQKRGAAVAIVKIDYKSMMIQYSCVGNVRFYMLQDGKKMIYPLPVMGYLSGKPQKLNTQEYDYHIGDIFFLHSDGIQLPSPKALLKQTKCLAQLSQSVIETINHEDDATFIAGSLLH
ncbi:SpoIIE family protein phosphatase [Sporosarcina jiandibaonis]|uniref:SpoIIE family protein phosphatase n=1 Tax=Sporosarcina jiandibaonis TaxID=2715535 RepID=UPI001556EF6C